MRTNILKSALIGVVFLSASALHADVVYTYTGNHFTTIVGTPGVGTGGFLSVSLTFASALGSNLNQADESGSVLSWSASDGTHSITSGGGGLLDHLLLSTDAGGNIVADWIVEVSSGGVDLLSENNPGHGATVFDQTSTSSSNVADNSGKPGTWVSSGSAVPEPAGASLFTAGLAGLMLLKRRKSV